MQRSFKPADESFRREVEAFIAAHAPPAQRLGTAAEWAAWREALVARGWSVPGWPPAAGGPGWSPTEQFIWLQSCAAHGIELEDNAGVDVVGPLLLQGPAAARKAFLAGIRGLRERWCIGFAEPEAASDLDRFTMTASPAGEDYLLRGAKTWVLGAADADWMCCLAVLEGDAPERAFVLLAVDMRATGVAVEPLTTLDGASAMARVHIDDVHVPGAHLLAGPDAGLDHARMLGSTHFSTLSRSAVARAQLDMLDEALAGLDPADDAHARRHALAIELSGLEAMELRYLDALQRRRPPPFSLLVLRLKSRALLLQLGALQVECFGYYALPYPDETLLHNEGPIGPGPAVGAARRQLARQVAALYDGGEQRLADELAREILGDVERADDAAHSG